jgi:beta-galactosidase/beta-glucuronidase
MSILDGNLNDFHSGWYQMVLAQPSHSYDFFYMLVPLGDLAFTKAMGNSNGNLHLYWKEFWNQDTPRLQGGFIWDMIDQGIRVPDTKNGGYYFAYGGDFGDEINDLQFCINVSCFVFFHEYFMTNGPNSRRYVNVFIYTGHVYSRPRTASRRSRDHASSAASTF